MGSISYKCKPTVLDFVSPAIEEHRKPTFLDFINQATKQQLKMQSDGYILIAARQKVITRHNQTGHFDRGSNADDYD